MKRSRDLTQIAKDNTRETMEYTPNTTLYRRLCDVFKSHHYWQSNTVEVSIEQDQLMMTIKKDDLKLKKAMDEGRNLLDQLSSFQKEKVDTLVGIENLRYRAGEVAKNMRGNRLEETFIVEHACLVETQLLQDYNLIGKRPANPLAEILASLERSYLCASPSMFAPSTPEYMEIYEQFKVAKYWHKSRDDGLWSNLRYQGMISAILKGENELSYLRAEAQRINADVREIIPRGMDSNSIVDWRLESMWLHSRANTILILIELKCAKAIEELLAKGGK